MTTPVDLERLLFLKSCEQWGYCLSKEEQAALAQAMSAFGQDPKGLEAKPASAVPKGCAQ